MGRLPVAVTMMFHDEVCIPSWTLVCLLESNWVLITCSTYMFQVSRSKLSIAPAEFLLSLIVSGGVTLLHYAYISARCYIICGITCPWLVLYGR